MSAVGTPSTVDAVTAQAAEAIEAEAGDSFPGMGLCVSSEVTAEPTDQSRRLCKVVQTFAHRPNA